MARKEFRKMTLKKKAEIVLLRAMIPFAWVIDRAVKAASHLFAKRKSVLSCMLAVAMLVTIMPLSAIQTSAAGITTTKPAGSGTEGSPYQIASVENLYWFAGLVNGTLDGTDQNFSACARLTQDIVVNENLFSKITTPANGLGKATINSGATIKPWTPIGNTSSDFYYGTFDGNGHKISGLYCESDDSDVGLFGKIYNNSKVTNVGIVNSYFSGKTLVGAVCGDTTGSFNSDGTIRCSSIENCFSEGNYILGSKYVGGIVGSAGSVKKCYNTSQVSGYHYVGGIAGKAISVVEDCYNTGSVLGHRLLQGSESEGDTSNYSVGGIIGELSYLSLGSFTGKPFYSYCNVINCFNSGTVKSSYEGVGPICGTISKKANSKVTNSYYLNNTVIKNLSYNPPNGDPKDNGNSYGTALIATQIRSGMVCYELNNGVTDGTQAWYQTLNNSNFPSFAGGTVYRGKSKCTDAFYTYANSEVGDGHSIQYTVEWDDGHFNCTKTATCSLCSTTLATETVNSMLHTIYPSTCTQGGSFYYTADFITPGFTQERYEFYGSARGHSPRPATYTLNADKTQMTAAAICDDCNTTIATQTVAATKKVVSSLSCTNDGVITYTANFTNTTYFASSNTITETTPATGHNYVDGICSNCGDAEPNYLQTNANGYYEIDSVNKLKWFAAYVNGGETGANGLLIADIDMKNQAWSCITSFGGTLDGGGHIIKNLNSGTAETAQSSFIRNLTAGGVVKNLCFDNAASWYHASGRSNAIIAETNNGTIQLCRVSNSQVTCGNYGSLGGLAAVNNGTIEDCSVSGMTLTRMWSGVNRNSGCITEINNGVVKNCYSYNCKIVNGVTKGAIVATGNAPVNSFYSLSEQSALQNSTVDGTVKTAAQFTSGEVTYLLNSGKTDGSQVWYQTCGTGLPAFSGKTIYYGYVNCASTEKTYANTALSETIPDHTYGDWTDNGDGTHSRTCSVCNKKETEAHVDADTNDICDVCGANLEIISVTVTWGAMEFTYTDASEGTWNPQTCAYENPTPAEWTCSDGANKITITSESNVDLNVSFSYEKAAGVTVGGSFTDGTNPVTAALPIGKKKETAQSVVVYLKLDGKPEETANKSVLGTVTVTIGD